jgi:hypothetical protein
MRIEMRILFALIVFAAACGSKTPRPPAPPSSVDDHNETTEEAATERPTSDEECDQSCAESCADVELADQCREDCGCPSEE